MPRKAIGSARGLMLAQQLAWQAAEAAKNYVAKPRELTPAELKANRAKAISASYEEQYRRDCQKRDAERVAALEGGRREDMFNAFDASPEERKVFSRANPDDIPRLLIDERNAKTDPAVTRLLELVTPSLIKR
jgi:hypothetical protein